MFCYLSGIGFHSLSLVKHKIHLRRNVVAFHEIECPQPPLLFRAVMEIGVSDGFVLQCVAQLMKHRADNGTHHVSIV